MHPRLAAAGVLATWILASMVLLIVFRGVPLRVRGLLILGSLLVLIAVTGWLKLRRKNRR